ncbi:aminotransferase class V-fold PLP-dependent enzyme [bacterium]|nr:aminotransferase class V-fold PLP-dependent enzyme [bacterium]NBW56892.1 aminotransferase class V-fold PLP-dependent enzyme [bacterium]NBX72272.1 aminotransferase class V-fold PLP-dependent enzyme [bacterium]
MYYCDNAATMRLLPSVKKLLIASMDNVLGNPGAQHPFGRQATELIDRAQEKVATRLQCLVKELIWTSGATEANNLAIQIAVQTLLDKHKKASVYYHPLAHKSLIEPALALGNERGLKVQSLPLDKNTGLLAVQEVKSLIDDPLTSILLLPLGNNELGWLDSLEILWPWIKEHGIYVHLDAAQSLGKIEINLQHIPCQSMSFSGHKMGAPVGIGALFLRLRPRKVVKPLFLGGGQQENRRSGTLPVIMIASFEAALSYWTAKNQKELKEHQRVVLSTLRNLKGLTLLTQEHSLPHIVTFSIHPSLEKNIETFASEVAYSKGSACSAYAAEGSHILSHLGYSVDQQQRICRLSFGWDFTVEERDELIALITTLFKGEKTNE